MRELQEPDFARALGEKLDCRLDALPILLTVRGQAGTRDGRIHLDRCRKVVTALLYLNRGWHDRAGRLRLLRSSDDLDDYAVEVSPEMGTLLAFRCTPNAWHGHTPLAGRRRVIQLSWLDSRLRCHYERLRLWQAATISPSHRFG